MKTIDLHVHTTFSDGTLTPAETVALAAETGLAAIAITDHDNTGGCEEAVAAGEQLGIEVVPGIEISTRTDCSVHMLGYYIDSSSGAAKEVLDHVVTERDNRNRKICALMQADGIDIGYDRMRERFGTSIGRPHFAELLVELGLAATINEAFDKYIERGRPYYVRRNILPLEDSIRLILEAGGVPVLAHPHQYRKSDSELRELIRRCKDSGLMGMECRYSLYDRSQSEYLERLADEFGLLKTGGSDFHGSHKPHIRLGTGTEENKLSVPYEWFEILKTTGRNRK